MKCPKCRREIALEAMECNWCHWRAVSRGGDGRVEEEAATKKRMQRKDVEVYLAKMREIVGKRKKE